MIIDEEKDRLYLFGGFFGKKDWDMPDFWTFDIKENKWEKILPRNEEIWPEPRCCHCLAYDSIDKRLYLLGGYFK